MHDTDMDDDRVIAARKDDGGIHLEWRVSHMKACVLCPSVAGI